MGSLMKISQERKTFFRDEKTINNEINFVRNNKS